MSDGEEPAESTGEQRPWVVVPGPEVGVSIERLHLTNLLSFGPDSPAIELGPLNVLIGPNGSGKSNLMRALSLLRSLPTGTLSTPDDTDTSDWCWRGDRPTPPLIEVAATLAFGAGRLDYELAAHPFGSREFSFLSEKLSRPATENQAEKAVFRRPPKGEMGSEPSRPGPRVTAELGLPKDDESRWLRTDDRQSVLTLRRHDQTEILHVASVFSRIAGHRDWAFGGKAPLRSPQSTEFPNDALRDDAANLGLVLNRLNQNAGTKRLLVDKLRALYEGIDDLRVNIEHGQVKLGLLEGDVLIPASHLSDGTLRFLCLLAILYDPEPPPLICLEEPELGLHPDILPTVGELLMNASTRSQLIVTTHSDVLVDKLTDMPDSVLVCEKRDGQTHVTRPDQGQLAEWLQDYSLGELWSRGHLGGNRW